MIELEPEDHALLVDYVDPLRAYLTTARGQLSYYIHRTRSCEGDLVESLESVDFALLHLDELETILLGDLPDLADESLDLTTVMIIDDDLDVCRSMARRMGRLGFRTIIETNPGRAKNEFVRARPRTVFIDVRMPTLSGPMLAALLREISEEVVIVLFTAFDEDAEALAAGFEAGADFFVAKDISFDYIEEILTNGRKMGGG